MRNSTFMSAFYIGLVDEQFYPDILFYDWNSINFFKEIIIYQKFLLKKTSLLSKFDFFSKILKELEVFKILNIIKFYHRNRLWKIENLLSKRVSLEIIFSRLSKSEEFFMISFKNLLFTYQTYSLDDFFINTLDSKNWYIKKNGIINYLIQKDIYIFFRLIEKKNNMWLMNNKEKFPDKLITNFIFCMKHCSIKFLISTKTLCLS